ncbi:MAG: hypothetical protein ABJN40_13080 [Sneathiella sp.]
MAYMSQEKKKELAPGIKAVLKEYGFKGSISVRHHSTLVVTISSGPIEFETDHKQVSPYWIEENYTGIWAEFLAKLKAAMSIGNHNNSDISTDYFDVGWYININIGTWDKPYIQK